MLAVLAFELYAAELDGGIMAICVLKEAQVHGALGGMIDVLNGNLNDVIDTEIKRDLFACFHHDHRISGFNVEGCIGWPVRWGARDVNIHADCTLSVPCGQMDSRAA